MLKSLGGRKGSFLAMVGTLASMVLVTPVQAQNNFGPAYGCACLHNKTQNTVNFRYKWGERNWVNDYLQKGNQQTLCWNYGSDGPTSPPLTFQIDVDTGGGAAWTTYNLPRVQSTSNKCATVASNFHYDISVRPNNPSFLQVTRRP
jgi:hypothetical protein